jgi:adenine deaminase
MNNSNFTIAGNIVDPVSEKIYKGILFVENGKIINIKKDDSITEEKYIFPGLINSHVHIESSMITPLEFSKQAVKWGTVAVVSDPHEIANVLGKEGIKFMINNSKLSPMKFYFGVPSCVPATSFETSGAILNSSEVKKLLENKDLYFLSEMMNYPGVIFNDEEVHNKLKYAKDLYLPIDGHAPGIKGDDLKKYVDAGISTDHECTTIEEAEEKISLGMKILIREGSAAKNFDALYPLISKYTNDVMLCTDDTHPDDLMLGHINILVKKCIEKDVDIVKIAKVVNLNPKLHYKLDVGSLQINDSADFLIIDDLKKFTILKTFINGEEVFNGQNTVIQQNASVKLNNFNAKSIKVEDIIVKNPENKKIKVINCFDGDLLTKLSLENLSTNINNEIQSDIENDILKIVVLNRYNNSKPIIGYIKGFGLKHGAIASSIAHDSHNIIAVGISNQEIVKTINQVIDNKGGIAVSNEEKLYDLPLEIAGLMTNSPIEKVASE